MKQLLKLLIRRRFFIITAAALLLLLYELAQQLFIAYGTDGGYVLSSREMPSYIVACEALGSTSCCWLVTPLATCSYLAEYVATGYCRVISRWREDVSRFSLRILASVALVAMLHAAMLVFAALAVSSLCCSGSWNPSYLQELSSKGFSVQAEDPVLFYGGYFLAFLVKAMMLSVVSASFAIAARIPSASILVVPAFWVLYRFTALGDVLVDVGVEGVWTLSDLFSLSPTADLMNGATFQHLALMIVLCIAIGSAFAFVACSRPDALVTRATPPRQKHALHRKNMKGDRAHE